MGLVQTGSCPKCGAPIYGPAAWWGITPPPPQYTCGCSRSQYYTITTDGTSLPIEAYMQRPQREPTHVSRAKVRRLLKVMDGVI